tara:strand:- start:233 stop:571 length:339 start_codon:yes stop_codon:yes gene_type:complete
MQYIKELKYLSKRIKCIRCNSYKIIFGGKYYTKLDGKKQRLHCKNCDKHFTLRDKNFYKKISHSTRKKILKFNGRHKGYINKFDNKKNYIFHQRDCKAVGGQQIICLGNNKE